MITRRDFLRLGGGAAAAGALSLISLPAPAYADFGASALVGGGVLAILACLGVGATAYHTSNGWNYGGLGNSFESHLANNIGRIVDSAIANANTYNVVIDAARAEAIVRGGELYQQFADWAAPAFAENARMAVAGYDAITGEMGFLARAAIADYINANLNADLITVAGVDMPATTTFSADLSGFPPLLSTYGDVLSPAVLSQISVVPETATSAFYYINHWLDGSTDRYSLQVIFCNGFEHIDFFRRGDKMEMTVRCNAATSDLPTYYRTYWSNSGVINLYERVNGNFSLTVSYTVLDGPYGLGVSGRDPSIDYLPGLDQYPGASLDPPMPWDAPLVGGDLVIDGGVVTDPGSVAIPGVVGADGYPMPGTLDLPYDSVLWGEQAGVIERPIAGGLAYPWEIDAVRARVGTAEGVQSRTIADAVAGRTSIALDVPISAYPISPFNPIPGGAVTPLPPWGNVADFPFLSIFPFNMAVTMINFLGRVTSL